jgi:DNA topoisomerase-1
MNLIIVESPTKARTLSRFLGGEFRVEATMGHIKDLPKSKLSIDIEHNFKPQYELVAKRKETVEKLKEESRKSELIYIATDPDREGEAIAKHVEEVLSQNGKFSIPKDQLKRIVFHEITEEAVNEAIKNPRGIDKNLVDAQIARRVLDRLVGYKLSPLLWKKIRRGLSAGRVQSVTVRLIVEREREIEKFKPEEYWEIYAEVERQGQKGEKGKNDIFVVQLVRIGDKKAEVKDGKEAERIVNELERSDYKVLDIVRKEVKKPPYPPFTTSTMTQAAARIFFWSSKKTMSVAQKLYEEGFITYHRTDSTNIAAGALDKVRGFIKDNYGDKYLPLIPRIYKTRSKVAQEAHEAIRPTNLGITYEKLHITKGKFIKESELLYSLIWKRFVACQMSVSIYDETTINVQATEKGRKDTEIYLLRASGQVLKFEGWKVLYRKNENIPTDEVILPDVVKDEPLKLVKVNPQQKFTIPPARYTEASLIKTLEKLGIGRPSTYAPIISTIQVRQYVEKNEGKFTPTLVGIAVNDFLVENFPQELDYSFTAKMESDLDGIANGNVEWEKEIKDFWGPFEKNLEIVDKKGKRVKIGVEKLGKSCPECKKGELVVRTGRFGKFISCSRFPDCRYTAKYIEKLDIKCPTCKTGDVIVKKTKRGKTFYGCSRYPECKWASWRKPEKPS